MPGIGRLLASLMIALAPLATSFGQTSVANAAEAAQRLPPAIVAVVDYKRILQEAKAAKSINDQIETRRKQFLDQLSQQEQQLHAEDQALAKQRGILAPDAFAKRRQKFEQQLQAAQQLSEAKRRELEAARKASFDQLREKVVQIVNDLADSRGFNLVLPSVSVLLFSPKIDLTDAVLQKLDAMLPVVKVPEKAKQD